VVVLGTLLLQGLTLRPLLRWLDMPRDTVVRAEVVLARQEALRAVLGSLENAQGSAAERLRQEYEVALATKSTSEFADIPDSVLRRNAVQHARCAIDALRDQERIGDEAYRRVERELDWFDLSNRG
jgi:CPA1 family monovalent cation:H+ antiporter